MEERYRRIEEFLAVCTELVEGKFIAADAKITEALRAIAASKDLTALFTAVTQGFDYAAACRCYLRSSSERISRGNMLLPSGRKDILAFVFCLMVDFDAGRLRLDEFLLRYFYVDGSYTASYLIFSDRVIRPFRDIVRDCFPEVRLSREREASNARSDETFAKLAELLPAEQHRLGRFELLEEERQAADVLLSALAGALGRKDAAEFTAVLTGYRYFLRYFGGEDGESDAIFALAAKL